MLLLKLLIFVIVIHLGMACTQVGVSYYGGDVADYGSAGIISHTPIGSFIDLEAPPGGEVDEGGPLGLAKRLFDFAKNMGDMINGLATFGYGFLTDIEPDDGAVYSVVIGFRLISALVWIGSALAFIYFLFDSNLLTSKVGLLCLLGVATVGILSGVAGFL